MDILLQSAVLIVTLLVLLGLGIWVGVALLASAVVIFMMFTSTPVDAILGVTMWAHSASWTLTALPLFIWMGEILYRTRLAEDLFSGLSPWVGRLPGGLAHVNVVGCGIFAAVSGSSAATTATVGRISLPELKSRGYADRLAIGSLAGSGTLGLLIPPSIVMIVYGVAAQVSINRLFIAGVLPGLMLMVLFSGYIAIWSRMNPDGVPAPEARISLGERLGRLKLLLPVVGLIIGVIGSIYAGIATATEAAAIGVAGALVIAALGGSLNMRTFVDSLFGATRTTAMIGLILLGAAFLTSAMSFSGLPTQLAAIISDSGLGAPGLIAVLTVFFVLLGCFLDGISIVVLTTSVVMPAVAAVGIDPVWFGIYLIIVVEMAQITPPLGFNLFVIQNLTGKSIFEITRMIVPYFLILVLGVVLLTAFPGIATWLVHQTL
ncbi:TRAP transporter large permease [Mameliella sediminis]|uniref:TRAP transporter large permease n=1 Tax=Mameliella sediminis TaxID=2836866 RepID=UPI001C457525|nr:TRAP transporter large permease subunit [Mameliella sediminis]MBY6144771.1 TRAP transporter large permease subunit [Mameliella alba]MBV7395885.1 TRAP transporter large permease subunit [Mameliella sediminis]MBY6160298.1 TRAP transporter large permease subunit [Mameliella alba]MBY6168768.1 TRAP transporter large permease subunit [Mameliella alba]MBY6174011.1 TRAP transporter large permease subunit [Mameliella alba]